MTSVDEQGAASWFQRFRDGDVRRRSPIYAELIDNVVRDTEMLALIESLPPEKWQPNLFFGSVRFCGGPVDDYSRFREWTIAHWSEVSDRMLERITQTNEPARCAALLPLLAQLPGPLALLEVGSSAGLCLHPDRYGYWYPDLDHQVGPTTGPVFTCRSSGPVPVPEQVPDIVWRAGIDLTPLDIRDPDDVQWLQSMIWPDQTTRLENLRAAIDVVRPHSTPPIRGDLRQKLPLLAESVPRGATLVVLNSAMLPYLPDDVRSEFVDIVRGLPGHWIANEEPNLLPSVAEQLSTVSENEGPGRFVVAMDEQPVAFTGPHGQWLEWF